MRFSLIIINKKLIIHMMKHLVNFNKLRDNVKLPQYATKDSVGLDIFTPYDFIIEPGERKLIKVGFNCEFSPKLEVQIRPKSGLALKHGITVLNSPGTIEADYFPNEFGVILYNTGNEPVEFNEGKAIAQLVFANKVSVYFEGQEESQIERTGGFGHTNK